MYSYFNIFRLNDKSKYLAHRLYALKLAVQ